MLQARKGYGCSLPDLSPSWIMIILLSFIESIINLLWMFTLYGALSFVFILSVGHSLSPHVFPIWNIYIYIFFFVYNRNCRINNLFLCLLKMIFFLQPFMRKKKKKKKGEKQTLNWKIIIVTNCKVFDISRFAINSCDLSCWESSEADPLYLLTYDQRESNLLLFLLKIAVE